MKIHSAPLIHLHHMTLYKMFWLIEWLMLVINMRKGVFVLAAVKSDYQGKISEGIHQAYVAAENLRMFLVCFGYCKMLWISSYTYLYFTLACYIFNCHFAGKLRQLVTPWFYSPSTLTWVFSRDRPKLFMYYYPTILTTVCLYHIFSATYSQAICSPFHLLWIFLLKFSVPGWHLVVEFFDECGVRSETGRKWV